MLIQRGKKVRNYSLWQVFHTESGVKLQRNSIRVKWKWQILDAEFQVPAETGELCSLYGWHLKGLQPQLEKRGMIRVCPLSSSGEDESSRLCVPFVLHQFDAWDSSEVVVALKMKAGGCYSFSGCLFSFFFFWCPLHSWLAHNILTVHKASIKFLTLCLFQWQRTLTGDQPQRYELCIYKYAHKAKSRAAPRLK